MGGTQPKDSKNLAGNRNLWECSLRFIGWEIGTHGNAVLRFIGWEIGTHGMQS